MSEIEVGHNVKKDVKNARVGKVLRFTSDGKIAVVEYRAGWRGNAITEERHRVEDLVRTCRRTVFSDYQSRPCDKKVKEDGLCGLHLSAERRAKARQEADNARWQAHAEAKQTMQQRINKLGLGGIVSVSSTSSETVTIKLSDLERIVNDK